MTEATYPHAPGAKDRDTSQDAADAIAPAAGRIQRMVLAQIVAAGRAGLTTNECADQLDMDKGTVQPRTSELAALGKIVDGGQRRLNASGKRAIVWVAA